MPQPMTTSMPNACSNRSLAIVRPSRTGARLRVLAILVALACVAGAVAASAAQAASYVPGVVVVGFGQGSSGALAENFAHRMGARASVAAAPSQEVLRLPHGASVTKAIAKLRREPGVAYAVPDYIAHEAGAFYPNDPGRSGHPGGWEAMQWNLLPTTGVDAPDAWANLIADGHPGGRGVVVAVLDTGVAYRNWLRFKKMPDFGSTRFADPYDFVANNRFPLDRNGHGTFVAAEIAESTNNGIGLTGLAYGATVMPVRILDASGDGDAVTIARGIRYAVNHDAQVINLSLEFDIGITAREIPEIVNALAYAQRRGVVVVAAAGNEGVNQLAYPAADTSVISVGATTRDGCLADYSNFGPALNLVAPGGGDDAMLTEPNCQPFANQPPIYQETLANAAASFMRFGYPPGIYGTSMAAPEVSATAALVLASGVIGRHPTPAQVLARLEQTAQPLGGTVPNQDYGYGRLDAAAATSSTTPPSSTTVPK
jgi:serine protease